MTMGGIWSCQWRELRPINFGGAGVAKEEQAGSEDGGLGYRSGRGRGRRPDGGGEYEMIGMKEGSTERV